MIRRLIARIFGLCLCENFKNLEQAYALKIRKSSIGTIKLVITTPYGRRASMIVLPQEMYELLEIGVKIEV